MKHSEFWRCVDQGLGEVTGRSLAQDLVLAPWNLTAVQALEKGISPQLVWKAMCQELNLGSEMEFLHRRPRIRRVD